MTVDTDSLRNLGLIRLNDEAPLPAERTIVVLGVARSGTTMVGGALQRMGIPVCPKENLVFEDVPLSEAVEKRDDRLARELIAQRNAASAVWGWKRPGLLHHIDRVEPWLRNPQYVVIFRDIFAIANRNRLSTFSDVRRNMEDSLRQYQVLMTFLRDCRQRMLLVSYEKAMDQPDAFVGSLASYVGVRSPEAIALARDYVTPEPHDYLNGARIVRVAGALDRADPNMVSGWAFYRERPEPAVVVIRLNGREVGRALADRLRPDFAAAKSHPTGRCGFAWAPPPEVTIRPGDAISVRVEGENNDLNHSPRNVARPQGKR